MFTTTHKIQGAGGAGGEDLYWLTTIAHSSFGFRNFGIRDNSSGSVFGTGSFNGDNKSYLLKFEADGSSRGIKPLKGVARLTFGVSHLIIQGVFGPLA